MRLPSGETTDWLAEEILPHEPALRLWLHARWAGVMNVDDVIQESYALLAAVTSPGEIGNPKAYLFTVARSILLQHLRRSRVVQIESMAEIERLGIYDGGDSPEDAAARSEQLRLVADLIRRLPPKCRRAFLLRKVDGLSQRDIASKMGISENTVEKHLGKALRMLLHWYGEVGPQRAITPVTGASTQPENERGSKPRP